MYGVRQQSDSFLKKVTKKIGNNILGAGIVLAMVVSPIAVFAKSSNQTPATGTGGTYNIRIAKTDMPATTVTISGDARISNYLGKEANQYLQISWGDSQTTTDLFMNYATYLKSSSNLSLTKWTATHSYAADASYTITARAYHGDSNGTAAYPAELSEYSVRTENTQVVCLDGTDNDRDVAIDLRDSDCTKFMSTENTAALCADGIDNDLNGKTDLSDPNCTAFIPPENTPEACTDAIDNDLDGMVDGRDVDCADMTPPENTAETCADGIDNDLDGAVDLNDANCAAFLPPENTTVACTDGVDNDRDGMVDGRDTDCADMTPPENTEEVCHDAIDNDLDGAADWNDPDCTPFVVPANCPVGFQTFYFPGATSFICGAAAGY